MEEVIAELKGLLAVELEKTCPCCDSKVTLDGWAKKHGFTRGFNLERSLTRPSLNFVLQLADALGYRISITKKEI